MTPPPDHLVLALRAALSSAYEIDGELTGGGMSRVFVATERALNRRVVIKVLPPDVAAGVSRERFQREIQLAAQLQHPHIVPLLACGNCTAPGLSSTDEILYYTMPFIEGESLKHALAGGTTFTVRDVLRTLHDVADALAYAHERGIVHRDVKPANVLRSGVHALVADFGVAKALSASLPAVGMTTTGMAIGTPQYMAPEQLAGDPAADHRVDIYALGLLGYELLTGSPTFAEPSPQATMAAQLTRSPAPLEPVRPDAPPRLAQLLMRCLAKEPRHRPATALEVRTELDDILMHSGAYAPLKPAGTSRRWMPAAAVGALALAAIAAFAMRDNREPVNDEPPAAPAGARQVTIAPADSTAPRPDSVSRPPVTAPPVRPDTTAVQRPQVGGVGSGRRATSSRARTPVDSVSDLVLLLRAQAPPDPVVRPPSPNAVSRAALDERRASLGPPRSTLILAPPDSLSRALARSVSRALAAGRFQVRVMETDGADRENLDTVAVAGGHEVALLVRVVPRRDSTWTGDIRLRDLTAKEGYGVSAASRRLTTDSLQVGMDTLAALTARRLTQLDLAPRAGVVDPEVRAFEERAAAMGPARRIVIWNHPPHDNLRVQEGGSLVMDVLRTAIRSLPRFVQVPRDSTLSILARSRNRETVLEALGADLMVSIAADYSASKPDSIAWTVTVRDQGAASQYQSRSYRSAATTLDNPLGLVAPLLNRVLAAIEQMDAAPRDSTPARRG